MADWAIECGREFLVANGYVPGNCTREIDWGDGVVLLHYEDDCDRNELVQMTRDPIFLVVNRVTGEMRVMQPWT